MSIVYRIYSNGGTGGPVDFSTPVAETAGLTSQAGPVAPGTDTTFVVRVFDTTTNLEEANTEARVRVVVGADGRDASALPNPPHAVSVSPTPGGGCRLSWAFAPSDEFGVPDGFHVYVAQSPPAGPVSPAATVRYTPGKVGYSATLPGPYAPAVYGVTVTAFNPAGEGAGAGPVAASLGLPTAAFDMGPVDLRYP